MVGQVGDGHDILVALAGKAHHKVELHAVPTSLEGRLGRTVQVLLGHVLVDDVAHALTAGFGGKRQAALLFAATDSAISTPNESRRCEGMDTRMPVSSRRRLRRPSTSRMQE